MAFPWDHRWGWQNHISSAGVAAWKLGWAGHTKWRPQRAGTWYWLLNGSLAKDHIGPILDLWAFSQEEDIQATKPFRWKLQDFHGSWYQNLQDSSCVAFYWDMKNSCDWRREERFLPLGGERQSSEEHLRQEIFSSCLWKRKPASPICSAHLKPNEVELLP